MQCQWKNALYIKSALLTKEGILGRCRILSSKHIVRWYTIQPPDWLGGKNILIKSGRYDFPEHAQTFDEKIKSEYLRCSGGASAVSHNIKPNGQT